MSSLASIVLALVQYLRDFFLLFSGATTLFFCYLWYSHDDSQEIALFDSLVAADGELAKGPLSPPIIDITPVCAKDTIMSPELSVDEQELQISFLMVSVSNVSMHFKGDNKLVSNFDRLKAQSTKTLEALALNRRRFADRSAAQVRKLRVKRAQAALDTRHCLIRL